MVTCFKLPDRVVKRVEWHVFSDASSCGYCACAYLRFVCVDGFVNCSLVMGKSHVAPPKIVSIPRLELTAAVVAAKLGNFIRREIEIEFDDVVFWTDANSVVLRYIHNTATRFQTFVANRLELLHTLTAVNHQWRYVPTCENPADIASRGLSPVKAKNSDLWFHGPRFLRDVTSDWPKQPEFLEHFVETDPEIRTVKVCVTQLIEPASDRIYELLRRYSSFHVLQRTVMWLLRYKQALRVLDGYCQHSLNNVA